MCFPVYLLIFLITSSYVVHQDPLSFPTRRSSDLYCRNSFLARTPESGVSGYGHRRQRRSCCRLWQIPSGDSDQDRKSTRLNSSHVAISYAVFCLKKKKKQATGNRRDFASS